MTEDVKKGEISSTEAKVKDQYSDGDVENDILDIFKINDPEKTIADILDNNPNWPMLYHLSPLRENLLSWYEFKKEGTLLEIGAGCGALTGLFCDKMKKVVAVELTKRRSEIIASRYKDKKNLTVMEGNLNGIGIGERFDYVTLIGVLEYAGKYTKSESPFVDFLKKAKSFMEDDGALILAIENKFGLKYWAGAREDHTSRLFDSIEGYPNKEGIETFSKDEIKEMLGKSGFKKINFYYPTPDYKLPKEIFSDDYPLKLGHNIKEGVFPSPDYAHMRYYFFDEKLAMNNILQSNKFDFFANSFLIFAKNK